MNVDFEVFEAGPERNSVERVHVTINERGHFFLNRRMLEAIGEPDAVTLMFDRRRSIIGVMPSRLHRPQAFPLKNKQLNRSRGRVIHAKNFCKHYAINPSETLAFLSPEVNKDGILILDLNDVRSVKKV